MSNYLHSLKRFVKTIRYKRNFYLHKLAPREVPPTAIYHLPHNFTVHTLANTGLRIVDNFCTREEANYLIEKSRAELNRSQVVVDGQVVSHPGRTSTFAFAFHRHYQDPRVLPLIARGAMLAGVPIDHAEPIYVSRYRQGELYNAHYDFDDDFFTTHRLCTMLIYLNDLDPAQGGATYFRDLNVAVQPRAGRAVVWTNTNPDGTNHRETMHAALPPKGEGAEKWVIQLWFRPYRIYPTLQTLEALQTKAGTPLKGNEQLTPGIWIPSGSA